MSTATATGPRTPWLPVLAALAFGGLGVVTWNLGQQVTALRDQAATNDRTLQQILGEVTRLRIEQRAEGKGAAALLEKLKTYAPLAASSRTTEPDYRNALAEMDAIVRAFASLGRDAWPPIQERIAQLKPDRDFDELKQLLRASLAVDRDQGLDLLEKALLGVHLPSPKLRWYAAGELIEQDRPRAQRLLRRILSTESHRGIDPDRARAYGAEIPDLAALATTGFHNFVLWYVKSDDPQAEEILLQVVSNTSQDTITVQECIKALAGKRSTRAGPVIEKLYKNPPLQQENEIFDLCCLRALVDIRGAEARPFLEEALLRARSQAVKNFLAEQLKK